MKTIAMVIGLTMLFGFAKAQQTASPQLQATVSKMDKATTAKDFERLAGEFTQITTTEKANWISWYYAALCNAKVGWLSLQDPDNIEPFANKAEEQIKTARSLLDTSSQRKELSEVYCVLSMLNRARVYMNPATYGRVYGPKSAQYGKLALAVNPQNPRAIYLEGWEKFSAPKAWGGDKAKAKQLLQDAKQKLLAAPTNGIEPHWGMSDVDELLGQLK